MIGSPFLLAMYEMQARLGTTATVKLRDGTTVDKVPVMMGKRGGRKVEPMTDGLDQWEMTCKAIPQEWDKLVARRPEKGDQIIHAGHKYGIVKSVVRYAGDTEVALHLALTG